MERLAQERQAASAGPGPEEADKEGTGAANAPQPDGVEGASDSASEVFEVAPSIPAVFQQATLPMMDLFWQFSSFSNNEELDYTSYIDSERMMLYVAHELQLKDQIWIMHSPEHSNWIYTGAVVRQREALVSTKKGAKVVNGVVISQLLSHVYWRRYGTGTVFLNCLAHELDRREGNGGIAFSVLYSGGSSTDFFEKRG